MPSYDQELLKTARSLIARRSGQRGRLSGARIRRSISTSYYALFHFILSEVGSRIVGTHNDLRGRRRTLARTISHRGIRTTLDKVSGASVDASVAEFLKPPRAGPGPLATPAFAQRLAKAFADAQVKRHEADYDMNTLLSAIDARILEFRVRRAIEIWRKAKIAEDIDFKNALCALILLRGQLRSDN